MDRRLATRGLPDAALEHVPHDHLVDRAGVDPGAAHGLADHDGAEARRGERGEPAEVLPDGRPDGGQDDSGCGVGSAHPGLPFHPGLASGVSVHRC